LRKRDCRAFKQIVIALGLAAAPASAAAQTASSIDRGCPPPPVGEVAAPPDSLPSIIGLTGELPLVAPKDGWEIGRISWLAADTGGLIYLLQRGDKADPVVVIDHNGHVVRSWGKGLFTVPHGIRIDRQGNVWTTDANTSLVRKFSPVGKLLLTIDVGDVPGACDWPTRGATDVAFAPNGHVYIADGYTNARIIEYSPDGQRLREWGSRGSRPGEFILPHSIVIDDAGTVYVADRENGRVQRFTLEGKWLGDWLVGGKPFTLTLASDGLWVDIRAVDTANRPRPTLLHINRSGAVTGRMNAPGGHGTSLLSGSSELIVPSGSKIYRVLPQR
jgi:DNA-binding beta-propeller fold protein YncE